MRNPILQWAASFLSGIPRIPVRSPVFRSSSGKANDNPCFPMVFPGCPPEVEVSSWHSGMQTGIGRCAFSFEKADENAGFLAGFSGIARYSPGSLEICGLRATKPRRRHETPAFCESYPLPVRKRDFAQALPDSGGKRGLRGSLPVFQLIQASSRMDRSIIAARNAADYATPIRWSGKAPAAAIRPA
jgi:hypothetical protein